MNSPKLGLSGQYKLTVFYGDSDIITQELPWFDNLITDRGLDLLGYGFDVNCYVGSNLTSLDPSICAITGVLGSSGNVVSTAKGAQIAELPYFGWFSLTYDFVPGAIQGTITELGIGNSATDLFSRAYLTDSQGQQTSLTLSGVDRLQLTYKLITYPPYEQFNFSFYVNDAMYTGIGNSAFMEWYDWWGSIGWALRPGQAIGDCTSAIDSFFRDSTELGTPITGKPNGQQIENANAYPSLIEPYVLGTHKRSIHVTWGTGITIENANSLLSGVFRVNPWTQERWVSTGAWQLLFSPSITKLYYQHLTLGYEVHWSRYTP